MQPNFFRLKELNDTKTVHEYSYNDAKKSEDNIVLMYVVTLYNKFTEKDQITEKRTYYFNIEDKEIAKAEYEDLLNYLKNYQVPEEYIGVYNFKYDLTIHYPDNNTSQNYIRYTCPCGNTIGQANYEKHKICPACEQEVFYKDLTRTNDKTVGNIRYYSETLNYIETKIMYRSYMVVATKNE